MTLRDRLRHLAVRYAQPIRYAAAGGVNTLFGLSFYPLLLYVFPVFRRYYLLALPIAQAASIMFAFALYKLLVFRTKGGLLREFAQFSSVYLGIFAINLAALPALVELFRLRPEVAQVGFALMTMVASYLWHSRITFRARES